MKKKQFCPVCEIKKLSKKLSVNRVSTEKYDNGVALTPPMGWSSWNLFASHINEELIKEIAVAMDKSGLKDAGYIYVNIDDCWQSSQRDGEGRLAPDRQTFPGGIKSLSAFMNERGMKLGLYSSNGTYTCEDYPASLGHEALDADTLAEWGVEYFKYDFCHNVPVSSKAPKIALIEIAAANGELLRSFRPCELKLSGDAAVFSDESQGNPSSSLLSGLCSGVGEAVLSFAAPESGEYLLTLTVAKARGEDRFVIADVNGKEHHVTSVASKLPKGFRRLQQSVFLREGENEIRFFNPVASRFDSAAFQYKLMGRELKRATREHAEKTGEKEKPIVYSICEWGMNRPYKWGAEAGNLWRTTPDIKPIWSSVMLIYEHNVRLWKYASCGAWNDPDMLEVGNGKLTFEENKAHFSLWCMMAAPLILGNDVRKFILADGTADESCRTLQILKNNAMIAIYQDALGVQGRRIKAGLTDVIVKPLSGGKTALCVFNKTNSQRAYSVDLCVVSNEGFLSMKKKREYEIFDVWDEKTFCSGSLRGELPAHGVNVFIVE